MKVCVESCSHLALGPSIKYVTLFLANIDRVDPLPPCHTLSHITGPRKVRHTSHPRFLLGLVQKTLTKGPCTNSLSIVRGDFCPGVLSLSGRFCPGCFLSVPPSVRMYVLQQKVKHHLKFHVSYV